MGQAPGLATRGVCLRNNSELESPRPIHLCFPSCCGGIPQTIRGSLFILVISQHCWRGIFFFLIFPWLSGGWMVKRATPDPQEVARAFPLIILYILWVVDLEKPASICHTAPVWHQGDPQPTARPRAYADNRHHSSGNRGLNGGIKRLVVESSGNLCLWRKCRGYMGELMWISRQWEALSSSMFSW